MKILNTGSLHGEVHKYKELLALAKQIKPDVLLISGDLFPRNLESPMLQADFLETCQSYLEQYSKLCDRVFYIFGEQDIVAISDLLQEMVSENVNNVHCLNETNQRYGDFTFIGLPYVKDTDQPLKDWVRTDAVRVNLNENPAYYTDMDYSLNDISDPYTFIKTQKEISTILEEKLVDSSEHRILLTHYPPEIKNFFVGDCYNVALTPFIPKFDFIFGGHSHDNAVEQAMFTTKEGNTHLFWHHHTNSMLLFNLAILINRRLQYSFFPLNGNPDDVERNAVLYREITKDANKNRH